MSSSASTRTSVLVVGAGSIGERHARCFLATGRADVSLCDVNVDLCRTVAERYGLQRNYQNLDDALADRPSAVVLCTPAHLHVAMARKVVQAGAHVLIEKPLGTTFEGIDELKHEAAQRQRTVAVAYVYRSHPALAAMREAIHSGRFGEPVEIVAVAGQPFPLYRPAYRDIYYNNRATGGGAVQDALTHVMNAAQWLVGSMQRLVADVDHQVLEGVTVEDTAHVITRHRGAMDNGHVMGSFSLNQHQAPNEMTITVVCRGGAVRFEFHQNRWRSITELGGQWNDEETFTLQRDDLFTWQAAAFLDATEQRRPPLCSLEEAVHTLHVNLAILQSAEERRWIDLSRVAEIAPHP